MENLAGHIIDTSFCYERMTYDPEAAEVVYQSTAGSKFKVFDALEWLAAMCSHVPNKGEQMVRYYGYCSNVARGKRKKDDADDVIACVQEPFESLKVERPELTDREFRCNRRGRSRR
jgi:hypothetical protein